MLRLARRCQPLSPTLITMADSSFDVVSKVDPMEIDNAVNQAAKEISQRYDFRDTGASVEFANDRFMLKAVSEDRVLAVLDVLQSKLIKRGISLKSIETGDPYAVSYTHLRAHET